MRKIILNIALSLDGYIAGPKGEFDWLYTDQDYGLREFFTKVDAALIGRKTYDLMVETGSEIYSGMKNYVFSRSRTHKKRKNVLFVSGDILRFVNDLKAQDGKDIWLVGGSDFAHSFFQLDLIDEMILSIHPIILGKGTPLFLRSNKRRNFELIGCKSFSTGLVQLHYVRSQPLEPKAAA